MLEPAMFTGLGAVAVWAHVRFPGLRPGSLVRAAVHGVWLLAWILHDLLGGKPRGGHPVPSNS